MGKNPSSGISYRWPYLLQGLWQQSPQARWLRIIGIHSLTVWEAGSLKWGVSRATLPLKVKGRSYSRPLFQLLAASDVPWVRDGQLFPVSLYTVCPCVWISPFYKDTSHVGLKPTSKSSSLSNHFCKDYLQVRSHSKELGLKTSTSVSRKTQFNL